MIINLIFKVDVNLAEERLKRENETNMHNLELELKEDDARWVLKEPKSDELADELKSLKTPENDGHTKTSTAAVIGAAGGGQLEQDDKLGYYNEWHDTQDELPQPTQKQMQREQQQIDDGIQLELNKDRVETMEVSVGKTLKLLKIKEIITFILENTGRPQRQGVSLDS